MPFLTGSLLQQLFGIPYQLNRCVSMPFLTGSLLQPRVLLKFLEELYVSMPFLTGSLLQLGENEIEIYDLEKFLCPF